MVVPEDRVPLLPLLNWRVTVPWVVGSQVKVVGEPAFKSYPPLGTLKALGPEAVVVELSALDDCG
jgi:hypothetical protein